MNLAGRVILMHQGGWDEWLLVLGPLIIIVVLVVVARKQVPVDSDAEAAADAAAETEGPDRGEQHPPAGR
ncbi:MAG: hypothetical protein GEU86_06205 [Actinophytocola sp.]|nr:hypothetical protein [Actinophytocola sp.]